MSREFQCATKVETDLAERDVREGCPDKELYLSVVCRDERQKELPTSTALSLLKLFPLWKLKPDATIP